MSLLDARDSRPLEGGPSFSIGHRIFRAIWGLAWLLLASWTPPPLHRWRSWLLRRFGADIDPTARVYASARVWYPPNLSLRAHSVLGPHVNCYCMDRIIIGARSIVSQGAYLCGGTHDINDPYFQLVTKPIQIGDGVWIAADAFVGPGVRIGDGAVIGARAVLMRDAPPLAVYVGNPASIIKYRQLAERQIDSEGEY